MGYRAHEKLVKPNETVEIILQIFWKDRLSSSEAQNKPFLKVLGKEKEVFEKLNMKAIKTEQRK